MSIENVISQGEVLSTEQLGEIAGGTGAQGNNTNGGICRCSGDDNTNKFFCKCEDKDTSKDYTQGPSSEDEQYMEMP